MFDFAIKVLASAINLNEVVLADMISSGAPEKIISLQKKIVDLLRQQLEVTKEMQVEVEKEMKVERIFTIPVSLQ